MTELALRTHGLTKRYRLGEGARYRSLRESMSRLPSRLYRRATRARDEQIVALSDVTFEIGRGEVVGVIGRNGAGKSTLLKLLSRITQPSEGGFELWGRVGSLLEVGTGFHPELTGRENIFLNGAILGMNRREIAGKFDAIVDFSEVRKFLDTPVKRYSSGMYVRLAFSVAAHLEPDILLIDEVLAVGDLPFQQKCLRHLRALTGSGMTVLIVSHNLTVIQSACERAILLDAGRLVSDGRPSDVIESYRRQLQRADGGRDGDTSGSGPVTVRSCKLFGPEGVPTREVRFDQPVRVRIELEAHERIDNPMVNLGLKRGDGVIACNFNNWYDDFQLGFLEGRCTLDGWLPPLRLVPDFYEVHVLVWPWGGGHLEGDLSRSRPYAAATFGDLHVTGVPLNAHDGVFQVPANRWRFERGATVLEQSGPDPSAILRAFHPRSGPSRDDGV